MDSEISIDRPQFGCRSQGCEFRTDSVATLRKHQKIHGQPRFTCLICSKSFGHKYTLEQHQAVHTDERKFKCTICSFRYFIKAEKYLAVMTMYLQHQV